MLKIVGIIFTLLVTSCFFFPFNPTFLPMANSKMVVAAFGLVAFLLSFVQNRGRAFRQDLLVIGAYSLAISLLSFLTGLIHTTNDYAYASFIMSFLVWTGAAYACTELIRKVHGHLSVRLVVNYLIGVCVAQCVLALSMEYIPALKTFVDSIIEGEGFMGKAGDDRLYGIGCALDVAGGRFAAVLCMIAYFCVNNNSLEHKRYTILYMIAFLIIMVIGSMIGRSTLIGIVVALVYWAYSTGGYKEIENSGIKKVALWSVLILACVIPLGAHLYNTNIVFHENLRFGFEGFFSMFEKGRWETNSNNILRNMIVFPDNLSTWIFGDGYIENPRKVDPYYIGPDYRGYYMATDIGYIRFLFYFGIIGTLVMVAYILKVAFVCMDRLKDYKMLFMMILILNLIYWCKVSTDMFVVFAPFLIISPEENEEYCMSQQEEYEEG